MADLGGGVYVSRVDSDEYEPDDEVGGFVHTLFEDGETAAGLWKIGSDVSGGAHGHELPARETVVVLEGSVRIEIQDGPDARSESGRHGVDAERRRHELAPVAGLQGGLVLLLGARAPGRYVVESGHGRVVTE